MGTIEIKNAVAVVTGASSGIGEATSRLLAARGASVVLIARSEERLVRVADAIRAEGGRAIPLQLDLANSSASANAVTHILAEYGAPTILVNNAGAGRWRTILETSPEELLAMLAVPFFAAFNLTRDLLPSMRRNEPAQIANVNSVASLVAWPGAAGYAAARWAMRGFSRSLRAELFVSDVGVTEAVFSQVSSAFWEHNPGSWERLPAPAHRLPVLTPEDAARAIVDGIEQRRRLVFHPRRFRLILVASLVFPRTTERLMCQPGNSPREVLGC